MSNLTKEDKRKTIDLKQEMEALEKEKIVKR